MLDFVKKAGSDFYRSAEEHSPEIALGVGIVSFVAATVFACKSTLKAKKVVEDAKDDIETIEKTEEAGHTYDDDNNEIEYTHKDSVNDKLIVFSRMGLGLIKAYGPAVILTTVGIVCMVSSHHILRKRNLALIAAYESLSEAYKKYQDRVKDILGETVARNLKYGIEEKEIEVDTGKKNKDGTPKTKKEKKLLVSGNPSDAISPYCRIFDEGCRNYDPTSPEYNMMFLKNRQSYWNDMLKARKNHTVLWNEVLTDLGYPPTTEGGVVGWTLQDDDGDDYIDFGIFNMAYKPNVDFVNGWEPACLLNFNIKGVVLNHLGSQESYEE